MSNFPSYPKVLALGHRYIQGIFDGGCIIEEKIDGSQISFGKIGGGLSIRSKGAKIHIDSPDNMFKKGVESILAVKDKLLPNTIYRGEYLRTPKHNTLAYDRVPNGHIIIFDIDSPYLANDKYPHGGICGTVSKRRYAADIGFETVPEFKLDDLTKDAFLKLLENDSCLGGQKIEGFVVKNYNRSTPDGKFMAGKYVSEAFKERHQGAWKKVNPGHKDVIIAIIETLKTDARYRKAVYALRDIGTLERDEKDIGRLFKAVHKDIDEEENEYIKDTLFKHFIGDIKRGVCGGLPAWYKGQLLENYNLNKENNNE